MDTLQFLAIVLLTAPFWISAILKGLDLAGATQEVAALGLPQPRLLALATIAVQALGSLSLILGVLPGLGAIALAGFTLLASILGHAFWRAAPGQRLHAANAFLANFGLIGGLMLAARLGS